MHITTETTQQTESTEAQVMARIRRAGRGSVWCADRFALGLPRNAIDQALGRMTSKRQLTRIAHGIYLYPHLHPLRGTQPQLLADVLEMLSDIGMGPLVPTNRTAAAMVGLCDYDHTTYTYGSLCGSRTIVTLWWTLTVRPIAPRGVVGVHTLTAVVIQAMRHIGQKQWNNTCTAILRQHLLPQSFALLAEQSGAAPAWMRPVLRGLAGPVSVAPNRQ
jgi:hypothetical protein